MEGAESNKQSPVLATALPHRRCWGTLGCCTGSGHGKGHVLPRGAAAWALLPHLHRYVGLVHLKKEVARGLEQAGKTPDRPGTHGGSD